MDDFIVGVADHGGWAILVTVTPSGTVVDRRRVELVDDALPSLPHHRDARGLPIERGVALVERAAAIAATAHRKQRADETAR